MIAVFGHPGAAGLPECTVKEAIRNPVSLKVIRMRDKP